MKQLSALDASFLFLETPQMPMHVGALHVFEMAAGWKGDFVHAVREHIARRLPVAPALRRKLAPMPFNLASPAWVAAEPDLGSHIVRVKLRKGSGLAALETRVAQLHAKRLDRDQPLWRFYLFDGLAPGPGGEPRFGLYSQVHHAGVDGQAAVALANAIFDVDPVPRSIDVAERAQARRFKLGMAEMLGGAITQQLQQVSSLVRALPATVSTLSGAAQGLIERSALLRGGASKAGKLTLAPRTPLNSSISDTRAFATVSLPLGQIKQIAKQHGGTVNDIVLMLAGSALRRYFLAHDALPRKSLIAAVPLSLRAAGDAAANNQASISLVSLGTHIADPAQRLAHVLAATAAMKATMGSVKGILPTDFPSLGMPWLMSGLASLYAKAKLADRLPPIANVTISNVPGPAFPLYLAGARMLSNHPTSIVVHGLALNITVQSYNGSLDFGLVACARAMPDPRSLARRMHEAYDEVRNLRAAEAPAARQKEHA